MDRDDRRRLSKAHSLANWSYVGILIPIVGWILSSISKSITRSLPSEGLSDAEKKHIAQVEDWSRGGAVMSWIGFAIGLGLTFWSYHVTQRRMELDAIDSTAAANVARTAESNAALAKSRLLVSCVQSASDNYTEYLRVNAGKTTTDANGQPIYWTTNAVADRATATKESALAECHRTYD